MADRTPTAPSMEPIFWGGGQGSSQVVWQTGLEVDLERTQNYCSDGHWPYMTPNDYQNIVFDEAVSLRGS